MQHLDITLQALWCYHGVIMVLSWCYYDVQGMRELETRKTEKSGIKLWNELVLF